MTEKRFTLTNPKNAFQEMKCGIDDKTFDKTLTFNEVVDRLNRFQELSINDLKQIEQLKKENEELKKELFEERKDYILETYSDNPVRRDERLKELEKELEE